MRLKSLGLSVMALGVVALGITAGSDPAHAVSIGSKIEFGWVGDLGNTSADFKPIFGAVNDNGFGNILIGASTGDFLTASPTVGVIKDLSAIPLLQSNPADDIANFITFNSYSFKLSSISYFSNNNARGYNLLGAFSDGTVGSGSITTQLASGTTFYSGNLTAVPTPALLPGLLALGAGVLRKRKADAVEASETVEAEA